jgi:DNA-binding FadR family transcriptional regulator
MRVLQAEGLIEMKRGVHGGAIVRKPEIHELAAGVGAFLQRIEATVSEVFNLRLLLEPEAARRVALRGDGEEVARVLDAALDAERRTLRGEEPLAVSRRVVEFHNVILALTQDRVLATFGELLETVVVMQNTRSLRSADEPRRWAEDAHQAHRRISAAIKKGDAESASRLVRKHLEVSARMILGGAADLNVDVVSDIGGLTPTGTVPLESPAPAESKKP